MASKQGSVKTGHSTIINQTFQNLAFQIQEMFPINQISKRNLLTTDIRNLLDHGPSTEREDFSQIQNAQYTQFECSQQYSQDFESQRSNCSQGSNNTESRRPASAFERYMSKPSLFRAGSQGNIPSSRAGVGGLQGMSQDRRGISQALTNQGASSQAMVEERAALSSIVGIVQKCTDEVKQNLQSLYSADEDTRDNMKESFKTLLSSVEDVNKKILSTIQKREEHFATVATLHNQIIKKDEKISELQEKRLDAAADVTSSIQESVAQFLSQQKLQIEDTLKTLLTSYQRQMSADFSTKLDKVISQQEMLLTATTDGLLEIKHSLEDMEQRPWNNNDVVPKQIQAQLDELFDKHKAEIDKLRAEMAEQRKEKDRLSNREMSQLSTSNSFQAVYDFHESEKTSISRKQSSVFPKNNGFLSPKAPQDTVWSSKVLFGRSNPSPVATVLPQRQTTKSQARQVEQQSNAILPTSEQHSINNIVASQIRGVSQPIRGQQNVSGMSEESRGDKNHLQRIAPESTRKRKADQSYGGDVDGLLQQQQSGRQLRSQSRTNNCSQSPQKHDYNQEQITDDSFDVSQSSSQEPAASSPEQHRNTPTSHPRQREKYKKQRKKSSKSKKGKKQNTAKRYSSKCKGETSSQKRDKTETTHFTGREHMATYSRLTSSAVRTQGHQALYKAKQQPARCSEVYDFHDSSPLQVPALRRNNQLVTGNSRSAANWQSSTQTDSYDSSRDSSPSLSITEIFIQRKVKGTRTPRNNDAFPYQSIMTSSRDFLSSPSLVQEYSDVRNYRRPMQTSQQCEQIHAPTRTYTAARNGGKRKLQQEPTMDPHFRHTIQAQKRRLY